MKKYFAEMVGTMVLVLLGCGCAIFNGGCGTTAQVLTVACAFGLSVVAMAYAIGGVSGCIPLLQESNQESTWWNAGKDSSCM